MVDPKPVIPRQLAVEDIQHAIDHYRRRADEATALRFVDAVQEAFETTGRHPEIGSSRWAVELEIPGLRSVPLTRFPQVVFYVERRDHVDVWRVLHGARDIATWMQPAPAD